MKKMQNNFKNFRDEMKIFITARIDFFRSINKFNNANEIVKHLNYIFFSFARSVECKKKAGRRKRSDSIEL